jgi:hypothetical protein
VQALRAEGVDRKRITAVDIETTHSANDLDAVALRGVDFLEWAAATQSRFDRIVGNPPYVRIRDLAGVLRDAALVESDALAARVNGTANYWLSFLLAALRLLSPGGSLAFILPAAWDYANYARPAREHIGRLFSHIEVHRSLRPLFPGKQEGSVVLICEGFAVGACAPRRVEHSDLEGLAAYLNTGASRASVRRPRARKRLTVRRPAGNRITVAREVLTIRLGGVTGDSRFFLLTEQLRLDKEIRSQDVTPVLSRARHIRTPVITREGWKQLRDKNERIWLLRPSPEAATHNAGVRRYLDLPADDGGCHRQRQKVRKREPWYVTPLPEPADGFMSGMAQHAPWVCLSDWPGLNATNTLYVVSFRDSLTAEERASWCMSFLSSFTRAAARGVARLYADGLSKLEPGDISRLPLIRPEKANGAKETYEEVVRLLLSGRGEEAEAAADRWLGLRDPS